MPALTIYGSSVADATLTAACDMAAATGGVETSKKTVSTASHVFLEITSQGSVGLASVTAIPAPTGKGWTYSPGAGTFATGNWSASVTLSLGSAVGSNSDTTIRFYRYSGGVYTSIGTINTATHIATTKTTYAFASTSMSTITFAAGDLLYVDMWFHDNQTSTNTDDPIVYESTSSGAGVANDAQVTTSSFTAAGVALSGTIAGVGTLAGTFSLATALTATIPGVGILAATLTISGIALSATLAGVSTLTATLSLSTALSATIPGVGALAGVLTLKIALTVTIAGVGTLAATLTVPLSYNDYKVTIEPNLIAALSANSLLNNVQVLGTDTTSASDATWLLPASIDLASSLSGYVRHAFPPNATDISNDSREVAVKSLVAGIYANDNTNKPIIQGEMGFGYAGPGQSVTLYQYGVDMTDYAVQLARAGMAALLAYDLDDDMHGTEWGMWQITTDTGVPRPWFFPWSLLCNTLVIGSTLYAPAQPASNDFRMLAAQSPQGFWTVILINRRSIAQNLQVIVPFAPVVTTTMQVFTYSQATPLLVDTNGFPLASGTLSVVLQRGFTTSIAANSVLILTQNAPSTTTSPPVGAGLAPPPPIGPTTISTIDVKRPPLEKRR